MKTFPSTILSLFLLLTLTCLPACQTTHIPPPAAEPALIPYSQWLAAGGFGNPDLYPDSPADHAARQALDEELKNVDIDDSPIEKVIAYLHEHTATNIFVNWKALEGAGIDRTTLVTVHLSHIPFRKALTSVLSEVGGGTANLGYTIDDGVIVISTRDDLNSAKYQVVRIYNIRDLLTDSLTAPPPAITATATQPATDDAAKATLRDRIKEVTETITSTVAPDSWRDAGGTIGMIRELNGQLLINQTTDNQIAIRDLLAQFRECRILHITVQSRLLLLDPDAYTRLAAKLPSTILDPAQYAQLAPTLRAAAPTTLADQSDTIFNGDATNFPFTRPRTYISAYQPNPAPGHTSEFLKEFSTVHPGLIINNMMTISADHRYIVVKTAFITRQLEGMRSTPAPGTPPGQELTIETPLLQQQQSSILTSIADGRTALIPGPLVNANFPGPDSTTKPQKRLLLILTPTIMIDKSVSPPPSATPTPPHSDTPTLSPATSTAPVAQAPPYSDEQAQAFAAKLPDLKYPTEIAPACQSLGIDYARLTNNRLIKTSVDGMSGQSWTRLSPNYWISFQFSAVSKDPGITRVVIYRPKDK